MNRITETDRYIFGQGSHYEIYEKLGAHIIEVDGVTGTYFAVWAPNAITVSVVGDFNDWSGYEHNMKVLETSGIWELFVPGVEEGAVYKYVIVARDGQVHYKADPYAFYSELRPGTASRVAIIDRYKWSDTSWIEKKNKENRNAAPMSIYEVHLGSWKKDFTNNLNGFYGYKQLAHELAEYVNYMGYTHIELMGVMEHPFDGSWGYQVTGYFAPTSRHGEPEEFMYFIDYMHQKGIGVILDWVPAHFPKDAHGLANFDGSAVYEYADPRKGEQKDWGTKIFDYGKNEVKNFLIANALFWVEKYHIDALRVDAVASMLYLDYGRRDGEWIPNQYGGNGNLEAMEFFKHTNSIMAQRNPRAYLIAEESTAWPKITAKPEDGGLGFAFKWNMGWMHDFLDYVKLDPYFKKFNHNKMTFGMTYAFSENFILVLSHDEVVHLKCSMLEKMPGYPADKMENLKTAYCFMMGHPGGKLLFMGQDFGQWAEWTEDKSLDWHLINEPGHKDIQNYVKNLLHMYKDNKVLHAYEESAYDCFEWINCDDNENSIFTFIRKEPDSYNNSLVFALNFTPVVRVAYEFGVPEPGNYKILLSSKEASGSEDFKEVSYKAVKEECDGKPYKLKITLKPFEAMILATPKVVKPVEKSKQPPKGVKNNKKSSNSRRKK